MSKTARRSDLPADLARAEADVIRARENVASSVVALRDELVRQSDWRRWPVEHPLAALGTALTVGYWLGHRRR
ncbi:MAG TPA: hypothetical protein VHG72_14890 [Polyangia bacterium]|nr:hypothetical protein [Polyangia bacterium]